MVAQHRLRELRTKRRTFEAEFIVGVMERSASGNPNGLLVQSIGKENWYLGTGIGFLGRHHKGEIGYILYTGGLAASARLRHPLVVEWAGEGVKIEPLGPVSPLFNGRTGVIRPACGGCSLGGPNVTAGTFACLTFPGGRRKAKVLSNRHVILGAKGGRIGDPVLQPGPADGGRVDAHTIGYVEHSRDIEFGEGRQNRVDAAFAEPTTAKLVEREILDLGIPTGIAEPELGMRVYKSGRTTGVTCGYVTQTDVSLRVTYGPDLVAYFVDQIRITGEGGPFSAPGDLGSAVVADNGRVVGLVFAGSVTSNATFANRFTNVLEDLGIS